MSENTATTEPTEKHKAGLFDIRLIIGSLLGVYGVVLLLTGILSTDANVANSKPINIWTGAGLIVVSAGFAAWTKLRPIVVPVETGDDD